MSNKAVDKFRNAINKGKIKDFRPYLNDKPAIRIEMAKRGILVDELIEQGEPSVLVELIEYGHGSEHYHKLKNGRKDVRRALASKGYFLDEFIFDESSDVRKEVIYNDPSYIKHVLDTKSTIEFETIGFILSREAQTNFDELEQLRKNPLYAQYKKRYAKQHWASQHATFVALDKKWEARNTTLSTLEATMSAWDLFSIDHQAWKLAVPAYVIETIEQYAEDLRTFKEGREWFDKVMSGQMHKYTLAAIINAIKDLG